MIKGNAPTHMTERLMAMGKFAKILNNPFKTKLALVSDKMLSKSIFEGDNFLN